MSLTHPRYIAYQLLRVLCPNLPSPSPNPAKHPQHRPHPVNAQKRTGPYISPRQIIPRPPIPEHPLSHPQIRRVDVPEVRERHDCNIVPRNIGVRGPGT